MTVISTAVIVNPGDPHQQPGVTQTSSQSTDLPVVQDSDSLGLERDMTICVSNDFLGAAAPAGLQFEP